MGVGKGSSLQCHAAFRIAEVEGREQEEATHQARVCVCVLPLGGSAFFPSRPPPPNRFLPVKQEEGQLCFSRVRASGYAQ